MAIAERELDPVSRNLGKEKEKFSVQEYFEQERHAETKNEYLDGEKLEMAGVSIEHDRIVRNLLRILEEEIGERECEPFTGDVKVQLTPTRFVYPDLTVVCGEPLFVDNAKDISIDILANPFAVFEVLSPSTSEYDLGKKTLLYRQLSSLQLVCLVAQDRPWVEVWTRNAPDTWHVQEFSGLEATAELTPLMIRLSLAPLYRRIVFKETLV